ncbi:hypothetical protein KC952_02880 [Candidatus Saccharibacteria bacterium]|jgi:hypothetical protein|nr:hypothetical protein [Candidatus Saccharibacteria bacterium]
MSISKIQLNANLKIAILIIVSITVVFVLVVISMRLYYTSGAAQLDLSRPEFSTVRDQTTPQSSFKGIDSKGEVNQDEINKFNKLFDEKLKEINTIDAFSGDVLDPKKVKFNNLRTPQ